MQRRESNDGLEHLLEERGRRKETMSSRSAENHGSTSPETNELSAPQGELRRTPPPAFGR